MNGTAAVAYAESAVGRAEANNAVQRLTAEISAWVPTVDALARAERRAESYDKLMRLREGTDRDTPQEQMDWLLDRYPDLLSAGERKTWWVHLTEIGNGLPAKAAIVPAEILAAREEAEAALPSLADLPPAPMSWLLPASGSVPRYWSEPLVELCAQAWATARDEVEESRSPLACWAIGSGMSKAAFHQLTGMSRARVDRYLDRTE